MERRLYLPTPTWTLQRWRIIWRPIRGHEGTCNHDTRVIEIHPANPPEVQLSTLFHETAHAVRGWEETQVENHEAASMAVSKMALKLWGDTDRE